MEKKKSIGVILFQLGGPDSLEAIEPFLYNLFCDPDIIEFPLAKLARRPLAKLIAANRAKKIQEHYAEIGGKSPILEYTQAQASALETELNQSYNAKVFIAMRYWHPMTDEVVRKVERGSFDQLVLLPLYPQYSKTTTGSSLNEWNRRLASSPARGVSAKAIKEFHTHPRYIEAVVERMQSSLVNFARGDAVHLVFSAHSVPVSVIEAGDPYRDQIEDTVGLVMQRGGWPFTHSVCDQSKVGDSKWLQPSLHETIHRLALQGEKNLLVVPISFVSDHVETLNEINLEAREEAEQLGITHFEMMPGLNDSATFIRALAELVREAVEGDSCQPLPAGA